MSRINALIVELCPDGVESKTLGELGEFIRGNGLQKKDLLDSGVPAIHYGQIHTTYGVATKESVSFTSPEIAERLRHAKPGDLLIATTSEDDEAVAKATAWLGESDVVLSGDAFIYRHTLEPRYVSYFFQSEHFQVQKQRYISGAKVRRISGKSLEKVQIPVPPLEVQLEIVKVLDRFTQLEAELEAELEARLQQYEHYMNALVGKKRFASNSWIRLADAVTIRAGSKPETIDTIGEFPYVNAGIEPSGFTSASNTEGGVVTIPSRGQGGAGHVGFQSVDFWCGPLCYRIDSKDADYLNRFLYFFLKNIQDDIVALRKIGSIPAVNKSDLGQVLIPVVEIEKQRHIVELLDKFDALVNDLSIGLPAEITARRQQYEYYRDQLLTFKELEVSA